MKEDSELLRAYAETGSEEAFAEIVRRHVNLTYSVAMRQLGGDSHLAQDVAQKVFTSLARKARPLSRRKVISGWLYQATLFSAIDIVRTEHRRRAREQEAQAMHEQFTDPASETDWDNLRPFIDRAISELNERDRDAVMLRFFESRSFGEIGARLQLSEDAARMRVDRSLEKVRRTLTRHGVTSTSAALALALGNQAALAAPAGFAPAVTGVALAGAATGGGALALFQLMSMSKIQLGLVAAALVAAGGTTIALQQGTNTGPREEIPAPQQENQQNADLQTARSQAAAELELLRSKAEENARHAKEQAASLTAAAKRTQNSGGSQAITASQAKQWLAAANDPQLLDRLTTESRAQTRQRYSEFLAQLNLPAEQITTLVGLLDDKKQAPMDLAVISLQHGVDPRDDPAAFLDGVTAERAAIEKKIRAFLGSDPYSQYLAYNQQMNQESTLARLQARVHGTENALTSEQSAKLQQLLRDSPNWKVSPKIITEAQGFLSPAQVEALQEVFHTKEAVQYRIPQAPAPSP